MNFWLMYIILGTVTWLWLMWQTKPRPILQAVFTLLWLWCFWPIVAVAIFAFWLVGEALARGENHAKKH